MAAVAGRRSQPVRAARLAGAVNALHPVSGWWVPSDDFLTAVRSSLDPAIWEREWEVGQAMGLEEAISYALEESD
jgi:hypothetical protein